MHTDPIADLLTRIRNAIKAHKNTVVAPYSTIKENILKVMKEKNFIDGYEIQKESESHKYIQINLKETDREIHFTRMSKPGQRVYIKSSELRPVRSGLGIKIISTSKGVMDNESAKKQKLGGELICEIS
ncbi:MAG: 30S ribosomal protein S8 [Candidatus Gracilibacteria bacterium]|jgi:small subunit ribosomal protein S8